MHFHNGSGTHWCALPSSITAISTMRSNWTVALRAPNVSAATLHALVVIKKARAVMRTVAVDGLSRGSTSGTSGICQPLAKGVAAAANRVPLTASSALYGTAARTKTTLHTPAATMREIKVAKSCVPSSNREANVRPHEVRGPGPQ